MGEQELVAHRTDGLLLDIGDGLGALVIHADATLVGRQIDLRPVGHGTHPIHNVVRDRTVSGRIIHAAVFPAVPAGEYEVVHPAPSSRGQRVRVDGGRVAEARLEP